MAKKYSRSPIFFRYLGGLDGDADVTDAEKASITTFMDSKSSSYLKYGLETISTGAECLVVEFRDDDEKVEFTTLVWDTTARRTATNGTQPFKKKVSTKDGPGHPAHKEDTLEEIYDIEE
jgi:hypothetical protein